MQPAPSAQVVGQEFVKQYYTMLHAAPEHLHRFYSNNSSFVHSGIDGRPDDQQAVTGQAEIHKKIMSLNFNNCHARICQVDCQSSVGGSIVVQVIGELSNDGQLMHKFVQSFVLAPQSAKKYYVHIDIFRYQDVGSLTAEATDTQSYRDYSVGEVEVTTAADSTAVGDATSSDDVVNCDVLPVMEQHEQSTEEQLSETNGTASSERAPSDDVIQQSDTAVPASVPADNEEHVDDDMKPAVDGSFHDATVNETVDDGDSEVDNVTDAQVEAARCDELPQTDNSVPVAAKPMTWAAMASRNTGSSSTGHSTPLTVGNANSSSAVGQQPQTTAMTDGANQPAKAVTAAWSGPGSADGAGDGVSVNGGRGVMVNGTSKDDVVTPRRTTSSSTVMPTSAMAVNYPDNQQVFVGNLPQHLTDRDLIAFFEQYGKVLDFKISRKIGGSQSGNNVGQKNFGFMAFDSPDTVRKVLSNRPIFLGKLRLNIEVKKPKEELAAARPSSVRGGSVGRRGGYGRGEVRNNETRTY